MSKPQCTVASHVELREDTEGWFLRLHAIDGSYCTLCTFPSKSEAMVVDIAIQAAIRGDIAYRRDAVDRLDQLIRTPAITDHDAGDEHP